MQLPENLQAAIDELLKNVSPAVLLKARESLTKKYLGGNVSPFGNEAMRLAYLGARMPATFAAVRKALENIEIQGHLLDLGAGLGSASWAAIDLFPEIDQITLLEISSEAINLGKKLGETHPTLQKAKWVNQSLDEPLPKAKTAILSYVLGELKNPEEIVQKCWNSVETLILIEPGTPRAFQTIRKIRKQLIDANAHLIAPCPHAHACPIQGDDWCHFSARVERTKLHRLLKEGSLGYEDEKFCYLIASKTPLEIKKSRIIRHPIKRSGHISFTLCTTEGKIEEKTVSKKTKEFYKKAKRLEWGDILTHM